MVCNPPQLKYKDAHQTAPAPHAIMPGSDVTISPTSSTWIQRASLHPFISIASPQPGRYSRSGTADHNSTDNLCAMWGSSFFITGESDTLRHRHPGTLLQDQQASQMQQVRDANCIFPFISNNKHLHIQVVRGGWIIRDAKMMIIKEIEIERLYKTNSTAMCLTPFKYVINTYTGYSSERPHYAFLRGHNCS